MNSPKKNYLSFLKQLAYQTQPKKEKNIFTPSFRYMNYFVWQQPTSAHLYGLYPLPLQQQLPRLSEQQRAY